ncbi:MAG: class I SAM-dependent methyltransferase, partial [Candidatus Wallbacteria bacterium]|nr:class I SAM-dependent methyltransferase [Candidatus Wallbacteria bacterium]
MEKSVPRTEAVTGSRMVRSEYMINGIMNENSGISRIEQVKRFWNSHPLFTGESQFTPGSKEFFDHHNRVITDQISSSNLLDEIIALTPEAGKVLDLGCGIGFWLDFFARHHRKNLFGGDISLASLKLADLRSQVYSYSAPLCNLNAENLPFKTGCFMHINCHGVLHHTPDIAKAISEIYRVLSPGGTISISLYHRNWVLRNFGFLSPLLRLVGRIFNVRGRGRENIFQAGNAEEFVRLYDGLDNPVGKCFTFREIKVLFG